MGLIKLYYYSEYGTGSDVYIRHDAILSVVEGTRGSSYVGDITGKNFHVGDSCHSVLSAIEQERLKEADDA